MLDSLRIIHGMMEKINQSLTDSNKEYFLKKYLNDPVFGGTFRKVLEYTIDEKKKFPLRKVNYCIYFEDKVAAENQNVEGIFQMLDFISAKETDLSDDEKSFLDKVCSSDIETIEVVTRILSKETCSGLTNERIRQILEEE